MQARATRRRLTVDTDHVEDMELIIHWRLRHQMAFIFEIDTAHVLPLLPPGIHPVEARPQVSLLFIGFNDYQADENTIEGVKQPRFSEMTRTILVQPDLSVRMPIPRFTFFVHRIGSDNKSFVDQEIAKLHLPSYHSPTLKTEVNETGTELWIRDEHGPIQHLRNTHAAPPYRREAFFGQYYTLEEGKLYFGIWSWSGVCAVHQRPGDAGGIFEHPFLTEARGQLPAGRVGPCYQQIFSRPGEISEQRFYAPRLVREIGGMR